MNSIGQSIGVVKNVERSKMRFHRIFGNKTRSSAPARRQRPDWSGGPAASACRLPLRFVATQEVGWRLRRPDQCVRTSTA